jgi:hypothetical protein
MPIRSITVVDGPRPTRVRQRGVDDDKGGIVLMKKPASLS